MTEMAISKIKLYIQMYDWNFKISLGKTEVLVIGNASDFHDATFLKEILPKLYFKSNMR